ncbi:YrrS family protein [Bacillus changyiensis]|uniref:YrrS family protein n=1 Tax=Bacillus changyiensis TaxID=3004103 RepID=UPI0022E238AC|nr:YrrS family protein [Bacillus changyiensis]MDA1477369.1 YrrS family protein [Bacillus changyiensis]
MSKTRESRFENRDKRRKANLVLNILIGVVLVLIVVVATSLLMNSPKEQAQQDDGSKNDTKQTTEAPASDKKNQTSDEDVKDKAKTDSSDKEKNDSASDEKEKSDSDSKKDKETASDDEKDKAKDPFEGAKITEGGSSPNVEKTIINPDWKPVGTKQSGAHTATYDSSSQDWAEMLEAISYATGVSKDNMTVIWVGNNGTPQDAKGTIQATDSGEKYQVAITWVDGKGWKPTKVEKLK